MTLNDRPRIFHRRKMKAIVTGGAGFIGSQLTDSLLSNGWEVVSIDVVPKKEARNHVDAVGKPGFSYVSRNIAKEGLGKHEGVDWIFHLAANSDVKIGWDDPNVDFESTLVSTKACLDFMRESGTENIFFSSTSAVYGDKPGVKLSESDGDLRPVSNYGACKLAAEVLISAHVTINNHNALVFRFPNVVGPRLTHGVIFDFIHKLKNNPKKLEILGDGSQRKQYVHTTDLINWIVKLVSKGHKGFDLYNVSTESFVDVNEIADMVAEGMGLDDVEYSYTGGSTGWPGDVATFDFDITKAKMAGWSYRYDSRSAVRKSIEEMLV